MLNREEVIKLHGISLSLIKTYLKPDKKINNGTGGSPQYFYSKKTILAFKQKYTHDNEQKIKAIIKNELIGITRPSPEHLTLTEAQRILGGMCKADIHKKYPSIRKYYKTKVTFFFLLKDLLKPLNIPDKKIRNPQKHCTTCNKLHRCSGNLCNACQTAIHNDPYNTIIPKKYGTRICSICGKRIEIGRYKCPCTGYTQPKEDPVDNFAGKYID